MGHKPLKKKGGRPVLESPPSELPLKALTLPLGKIEYCDGTAWYPLASEDWALSHALGTVSSVTAGTGLSGGTITSSGTIALANVGITPASYAWPSSLTINAQGQVTGVSTSESFPANRLSGYPTSSNAFLRGDGTWILPFLNNLNINGTVSFSSYGLTTSGDVSATTGTLIANNLSAYNSGSLAVKNPLALTNGGATPLTLTTNASSSNIIFNNTNSLASATGLAIQYYNLTGVEFGFNISTNEAYIWAENSATLKFGTNSIKRMELLTNGSLVMYDDGTYSASGLYGWLNQGGTVGQANGSGYYSISCPNRIKASEFNAYSSEKKKNLLGRGEEIEAEVLEVFRQIPFFKYVHKDPVKEGPAVCYGVTAESLQTVLPDYVEETGEEWVPTILQEATVTQTADTYQLKLKETPVLQSSRLKLLLEDKEVEAEICRQEGALLEITCVDPLPSSVFVYGTYESCPSVSKQKLFEMGLVVLQDLLKRVDSLEKKGE